MSITSLKSYLATFEGFCVGNALFHHAYVLLKMLVEDERSFCLPFRAIGMFHELRTGEVMITSGALWSNADASRFDSTGPSIR